MIKKLFCSLVAFGCVTGVMSGDDVRAMDDKKKAESLEGDDASSSSCSMALLPSSIMRLGDLTPGEWIASFASIETRVSFLINDVGRSVLSEVGPIAISLSAPWTLRSLSDFCAESCISESSRRTLSGLLTLFGRAVTELDDPSLHFLISDLSAMAKDLSLLASHRRFDDTHPIAVLAGILVSRPTTTPPKE